MLKNLFKHKKMKKLVLKNYFFFGMPEQNIISLGEWLVNLKLHGKESRSRSRFIKLVMDRVREIDEERQRLLEEYGSKDKNDQLIYFDKEKKETSNRNEAISVKMKDQTAFIKEFNTYLEEDFVIDCSPETQDTIYGVKDIILNTNDEFSGLMASRYNEWCDAFENVKKE